MVLVPGWEEENAWEAVARREFQVWTMVAFGRGVEVLRFDGLSDQLHCMGNLEATYSLIKRW